VPQVFIGDHAEWQRGANNSRLPEAYAGFSCCSLSIVLRPVGDTEIVYTLSQYAYRLDQNQYISLPNLNLLLFPRDKN
jgi:hypothetical protein